MQQRKARLLGVCLFFGSAAIALTAEPGALHRIELRSKATLSSQGPPRQSGALLIFHRHPDGVLMSLKRSEVLRIVALPPQARSGPRQRELAPGEQIVLGATGGGGAARAEVGVTARTGPPRLGERKDGTALFNPDREYRPDWDSKQVPGLNMPFPASRNDNREGTTVAFPPASAVQSAPGQPPMMPPN